jgi:hypothetical protein
MHAGATRPLGSARGSRWWHDVGAAPPHRWRSQRRPGARRRRPLPSAAALPDAAPDGLGRARGRGRAPFRPLPDGNPPIERARCRDRPGRCGDEPLWRRIAAGAPVRLHRSNM